MSKKRKDPDKLSFWEKVGVGVVGLLATGIILAKLAFLALVAWGIYELVVWVTSK